MEDTDQDFGESDKIIIRNTYLKNRKTFVNFIPLDIPFL